jgi:hypothetical protein
MGLGESKMSGAAAVERKSCEEISECSEIFLKLSIFCTILPPPPPSSRKKSLLLINDGERKERELDR